MHKALTSGPVDTSREPTEWRCIDCGRQVWYPEIYYNDNRCEQCHEKAQGCDILSGRWQNGFIAVPC